MSDTLGASMLRSYLRNQSCADRGGQCDCDLTCSLDMDEIVDETATRFRAKVREIMQGNDFQKAVDGVPK